MLWQVPSPVQGSSFAVAAVVKRSGEYDAVLVVRPVRCGGHGSWWLDDWLGGEAGWHDPKLDVVLNCFVGSSQDVRQPQSSSHCKCTYHPS